MTGVAIMNTYTAQLLWTNQNAADWGGKRTLGGGTVQGAGYYNIIRADLMLPQIIVTDDGYLDDSGNFFFWIEDIDRCEWFAVRIQHHTDCHGISLYTQQDRSGLIRFFTAYYQQDTGHINLQGN